MSRRISVEVQFVADDVGEDFARLCGVQGALESIHSHGNGAPISMPLIGNGQSSVNVEPQHLLRLIVLAIVDYGRKVGLPNQVSIIVPEDCFKMLDIREIRRDWRKR